MERISSHSLEYCWSLSSSHGDLSDVHYSLLPEEDILKVQKYCDCTDDGEMFIIAKYGVK